MGAALVMLDRRPTATGILFGLLIYKPQFGLRNRTLARVCSSGSDRGAVDARDARGRRHADMAMA
jgi:hypothetical protein